MTREYSESVVHHRTDYPLLHTLGIRVQSVGEGKAVFCLPYSSGLLQGAGVVAGGVLATLADEAMAHAVLSTLDHGQVTATVDISVRYLSPTRVGEELRAEACVIRKGSRVVFTRAEIVGEQGRAVASADASFLVNSIKPEA